jgi:hypothetical protein
VRRQLISLLTALDRDGVKIIDPSTYRVLQYNPVSAQYKPRG